MSVGGLAAYQFLAPQTNGDVDVAKSKVAALSTPSSDAEFAKGLAAFEAKNHEGAFEIWHPIAKDGHGRAQIKKLGKCSSNLVVLVSSYGHFQFSTRNLPKEVPTGV